MKKKYRNSAVFSRGYVFKLIMAMKLSLILVMVTFLQISASPTFSQNRLSLQLNSVRLGKLLNILEKKTDYTFMYNYAYIKKHNKIDLDIKDASITDILNEVLAPSMHYKILANHLIVIVPSNVTVRDISVKGKVTDASGNALVGVTVKVKGTTLGTVTDANGEYTLDTPEGATLVFSYVGFDDKEVPVNGQQTLNVTLSPSSKGLNEVVVVGYGTQKKVTVTGSVATVQGEELQKSPTVNLSNSLAGRLPGVTAIQSTGEPGYDGSAIHVRGTNTLGNSSALVVIDGVPDRAGGLERLNPADIESMSVLKDASAAIYGARAANGVILITTKHGKAGKPMLTYDFNQGWSQPTRVPDMADAPEYAEMNNELVLYANVPASEWAAGWKALSETGTYTTAGGTPITAPYQPDDIQKYRDGSDPWGHPNTDWFRTTFKTWSPQVRHTLQVSGGSESVTYLASLGYENQDAYYKNSATGYQQYDMRLNLDATINKYLKTSFGVTARQEYRHFPTQSAGDIFRMLIRGKPTEPEVWPNGLPGPDIEYGQNPIVITTSQTGYDRDRRNYFQTNGKVEFQVPGVEGLKLTGTASLDKEIQRNKKWQTPWYLYFWDHVSYETDGKTPLLTKSIRSTFTDPRLTESDDNIVNILLSAFINYDHTFNGDHTINLMAAVTKEKDNEDNFNAYRRYFLSPVLDQLNFGGDAEKNNGGSAYERARLSYFGRVAYNYKQKYLAEFLWRYDGSYMFPSAHRFGFFPGILAGWNISEENFWKDNVKIINFLKLRGSYGQMGNDQVYFNGALQEYQYLSTYGFGSYIINGAVTPSLYETRLPNPDFTWEVANNFDVGLEGQMLNGKLSFEFDYFYNKRTNILIQKLGSTPASAGITLPPVNLGRVDNKGYEFKVGYNGQAGDFTYSVSVNGGYAKNKVVFYDEPPGAPDWQKATGHSFGSNGYNFLAYEYDGVFKDEAEIKANTVDYSALVGELRPGDMKFKDVDHNGKINADDQVRLDKNRDPTFSGGMNINLGYKNFDCSIMFQGATGGLLYINIGNESGDIGNFLQYDYDHQWTVDKPSSVYPRIANRGDTYYTQGAAGNNTYWLRSSNYLRLKNFEIGYTLPATIGKKAAINNLRIYVSGLNLVTWDKMKIWDPESTSSDAHYYPQARILNVGASVKF